ncbi:MAG: YIP1 family protein [Sphingomonadales bacterium]|nr:YIP1 family protein [Sphingomonadales bacterium]
MTTETIKALVWLTLRAPQQAAAALLALNLPGQARALALAVVVVLSAMLGTLAEIVFAFVTKVDLGPAQSPVSLALLQGALLIYGAAMVTVMGRQVGGRGRFADALVLLAWIEFVLILGQIVQMVVMVLFPLVAVLATLGLVGLMFWLLVNFVAALHGFTNLMAVGAGVIAGFIASALIAGIVLVALGIVPVPAPA